MICREGIVNRTEVEPRLLDDLRFGARSLSRGCLSEDDCKACFEMPIYHSMLIALSVVADTGERTNVTVQEPRPGVVGSEADDDCRTSNTDNVAAGRVGVVGWTTYRLDNIECMSVETTTMLSF